MDLSDEGHPLDIIFLDFRKAFDRVPHERLLFKLKMGIQGLAWVESFLGNRKQRVVLNQSLKWRRVRYIVGYCRVQCWVQYYFGSISMICLTTLRVPAKYLQMTQKSMRRWEIWQM